MSKENVKLRIGGRYGRWKAISPPSEFGTRVMARCTVCKMERVVPVSRLIGRKTIQCKCAKREAKRRQRKGTRPKMKVRNYPELAFIETTSGVCFYGCALLVNKNAMTNYIFSQWIGYRDGVPFITIRREKPYYGFYGELYGYNVTFDAIMDVIKVCDEQNIASPVIFTEINAPKKIEEVFTKHWQKQDLDLLAFAGNLDKVRPEFRQHDYSKQPYAVIKEVLKDRAVSFQTKLYTTGFYNDYGDLTVDSTSGNLN